MNCVGFSITIVSIEVFNLLIGRLPVQFLFVLLGAGPVLGLFNLWFLHRSGTTTLPA